MRIRRLSRIKNYRIFQDFTWRPALEDFGRFNLIFGWNGSGKTTLSNLFRCMERRQPVESGEVIIDLDNGNQVTGSSLSAESVVPDVKVFNRDFIASSVFVADRSRISPIFFLGEDSAEKGRQVEALKRQLEEQRDAVTSKEREAESASRDWDSFCAQQAKVIKELLSSSGRNTYNNYDKRSFRKSCEAMASESYALKLLEPEQKAALKRQKDSPPKESIPEVDLCFGQVQAARQGVGDLVKRVAAAQVLEELTTDSGIAQWVREGVRYHTNEYASNSCRFCGQHIPEIRLEKLLGHFSDEYGRLVRDIDSKIDELRAPNKTTA